MALSFRSRVAALAVGAVAAAGACQAQELRMGFGYATHTPEVGGSFLADFVFPQLKFLKFLGSPRPYIGTQISLQGFTDFAQAGLLWRIQPQGPLYLDLGAGLAVHNGDINVPPPMDGLPPEENAYRRHERDTRNQFQHEMLYHATFALGWRLNPKWAVEFDGQHWSNGHLGTNTNDGADSLGLRVGYTF